MSDIQDIHTDIKAKNITQRTVFILTHQLTLVSIPQNTHLTSTSHSNLTPIPSKHYTKKPPQHSSHSAMSLSQLSRLLPLPDSELQQILDYAATLPKTAAAEHLSNLLGTEP